MTLNVLVIAPWLYNTSPSQRYRIEQWMPYLQGHGFRFTIVPFEDEMLHEVIYRPKHYGPKVYGLCRALLRRVRLLFSVRDYDLVYLVREAALVGPALLERLVALQRVPLVYDFDDAIWIRYTSLTNGRLARYFKFPQKVSTICRLCDHVVVGNAYLADFARQYNDHVTIIPTTIDTLRYQPAVPRSQTDSDLVTLGWTGSHSTVPHLDHLRPTLLKLHQKVPFRLAVVGTHAYELKNVDIDVRPWSAQTEVRDFSRFDIGLMPLPDDQWARGKCGCKLLTYMSFGIPSVASPVGVNAEIVEDGVNGFLARSEDEWVDRLYRLVSDAALRKRIGAAGRVTVEAEYSANRWVPRVRDLFESLGACKIGNMAQERIEPCVDGAANTTKLVGPCLSRRRLVR